MSLPITVADAAIAIGGDLTGFDKSLGTAEKSAKSLGGRLKDLFSPKNIIGGLGLAAGGAFGLMTKGGMELNATLTDVQARSGAVGAQWDAMSDAIQRQNRRTTLSLDEIGDGVEALKTDLGATADEIGMASDRLTDFGLVARESFGSAVRGADDLKDAYQTTLLEALGILDALVVSHQTYGGSLVANREALVALAPALSAANLEWTDGLALINLFNAAGVDAAAIPLALQKALTAVHSPAELKALIADIQATEDPFLRAEKAADLFGSRAGVKMAAALSPGRGALEDYVVGVAESAGATETAARKIDSSWKRTLELIVQNVTGVLAQVGNATGPILSFASSIGTILGAAFVAFPGLAPAMIAKVTGAVAATGIPAALAGTGVGGMIGTAIGVAIPLALVAAAGVGIALAVKAIFLDPGLQQQTRDIGKAVGEQIAAGTLEQLQQSKGALEAGIANINALPLGGFLYGDQVRDLQTQLDAVNAKLLAGGEEMPKSVAAGIETTTPVVEIAVADLVKTLGTRMAGVLAAAKVTGADGMLAMAQGITGARQKPLDAFDTLTQMLKHQMTPWAETARLAGQLTSKELAAGLKSRDPAVRAQALAVKQSILDRLNEIQRAGHGLGTKAMDELRKGMKSKDPEIRTASKAAYDAALSKLRELKDPAGDAGGAAGAAFAAALKAAAETAMAHLRAPGGRDDWRLPPVSTKPNAFATGTPFVPFDQLAFIHRGEAIIPAEQNKPGVMSGGNTYQVNVQGLVRARSPLEIATQLRRLGDFGVLSPRREPA